MPNPWLTVPAADYIGHMSHASVGQYEVIGRLFRDVLRDVRPRDVLLLGCGTGNGLEHVDPAITFRVVCVDVNPAYLEQLQRDFAHAAFIVETRCVDLSEAALEADAVDLVYAALVFEYVPWVPLLARAAAALRAGGVLETVVQRPSASIPAVTPTGYASLHALESVFSFVDSDRLVTEASVIGLRVESRRTEPLASGKSFEIVRFRRA